MTKQPSKNKTPQKPYSNTSGLWVSFGAVAVAAVLNIIFISVVLADRASFMLYTASTKLGTSSHLMDPQEAALRTSIEVGIGILATLVVMLLTFLKKRDWIRLVVLLQTVFTGVSVAPYAYSVIYLYTTNKFISLAVGIVVTLIAVVTAAWYAHTLNPIDPKSFKKTTLK